MPVAYLQLRMLTEVLGESFLAMKILFKGHKGPEGKRRSAAILSEWGRRYQMNRHSECKQMTQIVVSF